MSRTCFALLTLLAAAPAWAAPAYSIKVSKAEPPREVPAAFARLLGLESVQLLDKDSKPICNLWICKEVPGATTDAQAQKGLGYRDLKETTFLGVLQIVQAKGFTDYRKQAIGPGVYSLRLGFQPQDGDHMGTAPQNEFCLLVPIAEEKGPAPLEGNKALVELSAKATGSGHPGVLLLFPTAPQDPPQLVASKEYEDHWMVNGKINVLVNQKRYPLGFSLTLVGRSSSL